MAEQSRIAEEQNGPHPTAQLIGLTASKHEHPAMEAAQAPTGKSMIDRVVGETEATELHARDHAVLPNRKPPRRPRVLVTSPRYSPAK
jgi:hypothetical protein